MGRVCWYGDGGGDSYIDYYIIGRIEKQLREWGLGTNGTIVLSDDVRTEDDDGGRDDNRKLVQALCRRR